MYCTTGSICDIFFLLFDNVELLVVIHTLSSDLSSRSSFLLGIKKYIYYQVIDVMDRHTQYKRLVEEFLCESVGNNVEQ